MWHAQRGFHILPIMQINIKSSFSALFSSLPPFCPALSASALCALRTIKLRHLFPIYSCGLRAVWSYHLDILSWSPLCRVHRGRSGFTSQINIIPSYLHTYIFYYCSTTGDWSYVMLNRIESTSDSDSWRS